MGRMNEAAEKALKECMGLKRGEECLVITDEYSREVGESLYEESKNITSESYILVLPNQEMGVLKPPEIPQVLLKSAPEVVMIPTQNSYTHMDVTLEACSKGSRIATLPGVTEDMFKRAVDIDYGELREEGRKLKERMEAASYSKIKTKSGTNIKIRLSNDEVIADVGELTKPGKYPGNLPTGEVFTAPDEKEVNGKIVIDSMQDIAKPKTEVFVQEGEAKEVEGDDEFKEKLWSHRNGRNIAEFGIGLNPNARITGKILEDEKVKGTCHIAFGKNKDFGGNTDSDIHWDAILIKPDIWFDEEKIMSSGKLLI